MLPTLYPPLGGIPAPYGTRLSAANPIVVSQEAHPKGGTLNAQDLDSIDDRNPVYAPCDGVVDDVQLDPDCGQSLHVTRDDGLRVTLCHLSQKLVTSGRVRAGQRLGTMGTTGHSTGPHLHWVVRWQGRNVYPGSFPQSLGKQVSEMVIGRTPDGQKVTSVSDWTQALTQGTVIRDAPNGNPKTRMPKDAAVEFYGVSDDGKWHEVEVGSPAVSPFPIKGWVEAGPVTQKLPTADSPETLRKRLAAKDAELRRVRAAANAGLAA